MLRIRESILFVDEFQKKLQSWAFTPNSSMCKLSTIVQYYLQFFFKNKIDTWWKV